MTKHRKGNLKISTLDMKKDVLADTEKAWQQSRLRRSRDQPVAAETCAVAVAPCEAGCDQPLGILWIPRSASGRCRVFRSVGIFAFVGFASGLTWGHFAPMSVSDDTVSDLGNVRRIPESWDLSAELMSPEGICLRN